MSYVIRCLLPTLLYILFMTVSLLFYNLKAEEPQEEESLYAVGKIVKARRNQSKRRYEFHIKWEGYTNGKKTWKLRECLSLVLTLYVYVSP